MSTFYWKCDPHYIGIWGQINSAAAAATKAVRAHCGPLSRVKSPT